MSEPTTTATLLNTLRLPLFVPGDRPERFAKAEASGADCVIIDLEDAVAPEAKDLARTCAGRHELSRKPVLVRINGVGSPWFEDDLAALAVASISGVVLPKAERDTDIRAVRDSLGDVAVVPLIETARGLINVAETLSAAGVAVAAFGSLDLALDLGSSPSWEALSLARQHLVLHSRLAGLPGPLDGVTTNFTDPDLVEADARRAAELGFSGKLLIHPAQAEPAQRGLQPSDEAVRQAERIVAAGTGGAVQVDGTMVDRPLVERAMHVLAARVPD